MRAVLLVAALLVAPALASANAVCDAKTGACAPVTATALSVTATPSAAAAQALSSKGLATLTASASVKATPGSIYGFAAVNGAVTVCWVQCVNSAAAGTLGTAVIFQYPLPASGALSIAPGAVALANGAAGIACGIASAVDGAGACGTAGNLTVFYK